MACAASDGAAQTWPPSSAVPHRRVSHPRLTPLWQRVQSPDAEAAGAAFVTLMALMGDEAACGQQAAAAAASSGQAGDGGQAGARTASSLLLVDAHYGLAPGKPLPPCAMECVPTDQQLMEALRANGYRPGRGGGGGGKRRQQDQQQQLGQQQQEEEGGGEGQEGRAVRVQAVKLIFRTAAAVCRYCQRVRLGCMLCVCLPGWLAGWPACCRPARCVADLRPRVCLPLTPPLLALLPPGRA